MGGLQHGCQGGLGAVRHLHQVFDQEHAAHAVDAAFVDGQAGVAAGGEGGPGGGDVGLDGQSHDAGAGGHDLAHHRIAEADHIADQLPVLGFQDALGLALFQQGGDGLIGGLFLVVVPGSVLGALAVDNPGDGMHQGPQGRHDRGEEREQPLQPQAGFPGGEQGRQEQVQQPEGDQHEPREGPTAAGQASQQGPGQGRQGQQQELIP